MTNPNLELEIKLQRIARTRGVKRTHLQNCNFLRERSLKILRTKLVHNFLMFK